MWYVFCFDPSPDRKVVYQLEVPVWCFPPQLLQNVYCFACCTCVNLLSRLHSLLHACSCAGGKSCLIAPEEPYVCCRYHVTLVLGRIMTYTSGGWIHGVSLLRTQWSSTRSGLKRTRTLGTTRGRTIVGRAMEPTAMRLIAVRHVMR